MRRAVEKCDVNVIGLTLSKNQAAHVQKSFHEMDSPPSKRVLLNAWKQVRFVPERAATASMRDGSMGNRTYPACGHRTTSHSWLGASASQRKVDSLVPGPGPP
jgi:hypothetical protein